MLTWPLSLRIAIPAGAVGLGLTTAALRVRSAPAPPPADAAAGQESAEQAPRHPVRVNRPAGPPRALTGELDAAGNPVTASCTTCHATRTPDTGNRSGSDLDEFHQGLVFQHGTLACLSCHSAADYDALSLADGSPVRYEDVALLCAQCHARQAIDYDHGVHGGMNGYWDLTRGPRSRNGCIDCHDPHVPAFPRMLPTFKPIDRFLRRSAGAGEADHE